MSIADKRIGFVGVGNMGEALVRGLTKTGVVPVDHLVMTDVRADRVEELKRRYGRKKKMRKLKEKLQAPGADREKLLYKIHRLSPSWTESSLKPAAPEPPKEAAPKPPRKRAPKS